MAGGDWNVEQFERFKRERYQPGFDLVKLIQPAPEMCCLDLGCGTGELTKHLHKSLGAKSTLGVDSSDTMLAKARTFEGSGLTFEKGRIETYRGGPFDVIYSNAALQWVPDHERTIPRLGGMLAEGGQLAIQIPFNRDNPSQAVAFELEEEAPFRGLVRSKVELNVLPLERYAEILDEQGFEQLNVRMHVYIHHLESREEVVEWVKGTFLLDYQRALSPELFSLFLERYRERLMSRLPDRRPFLFTFKRILMCGRKG